MVKRILGLAIVALFLVSGIQPAFAKLNAVGPTNAVNGYPAWYQDSNGTTLQLGNNDGTLDPALNIFDAVIPGNNFSAQIGFGSEAFYFYASNTDAGITIPIQPGLPIGGRFLYIAGLEAAFGTGDALNGEQIVFGRIRIRLDCPVAGTYKITHPYGVDTFTVDAPGLKAINFTEDIGVAPLAFTGALSSRIGPFLKAVSPAAPVDLLTGRTFIGSPSVAQTVTGSPFGTNFLRIEGPSGADLDGALPGVQNVWQSNEFFLSGTIFNGVVSTPLAVDRVNYERGVHSGVDIIATSSPTAQVSVSGLTAVAAVMTGDGTGKFYRHVHVDGALPATVTVSAVDAPNTQTSIIKNLIDVVNITRAEYDLATRALTIEAASGDTVAPPVLTATGLGDLVAGSLVVPGVLVPPASVSVTSSLGGSDTASVSIIGHDVLPNAAPAAANDAVNTVVDTAVVINVLANDVDQDGTINPATLTLINPAALDLAINPLDNTVTFTPALGFVGAATFSYTVQDDLGAVSNTATVTINVASAAPAPNIPPVAVNDAATSNIGVAVSINVVANDTDANGIDAATVLIETLPASGAVVNNLDGTVTYAPNGGFQGADSFTYSVKDSLGAISNIATVNITVTATETLTTTSALFRIVGARWIISGTSTVPGATITIRLNGGATLGTATVSPLGIWSLALRNSANVPVVGATLRIESTGGARLDAVPVTIRN